MRAMPPEAQQDPNGYQGDDAVVIDGYRVDPHTVDLYFDMRTGERVSDEEWDETRRRLELAEAMDADAEA